MNFNLVEMYNGLLRFNKHILNELAEGLKHLPNLDGVSKGDNLIINEQGNPAWGSAAFIPTFENAAYGIEWTKNDNDIIRIGNAKFHRELPIKKADYNWIRGNNGQDTDKSIRVLLLGGYADNGSKAGSDGFYSLWVRSDSHADVGFFTTIKLD